MVLRFIPDMSWPKVHLYLLETFALSAQPNLGTTQSRDALKCRENPRELKTSCNSIISEPFLSSFGGEINEI